MEVDLQQDTASNGVTLDRIHARGTAYYFGWELSAKLLGGIDGDHGLLVLDRIKTPNGEPGWRVMTPQEWAAMPPSTIAGVGDDHMPVIVKACCLRPLLEEVGLGAAVISALVDVPASSDETKGTCYEVSPADDGSPGYTLRVEKVTLPLDTSSPPAVLGITLPTPQQLESGKPGLPTTSDLSTGGSSKSGGPAGIPKMPVVHRKRGMSSHGAASEAKTGGVHLSHTQAACRSIAQGAYAVPQAAAQLRRAGSTSPLPNNMEPAHGAGSGLRTTTDGECLSDTAREADTGNCGATNHAGKCRMDRGRHCESEGHDLSRQAAGGEGRVWVESVELPDVQSPAGEAVVVDVIHTQGASFCIPAQLAMSVLGQTPRKAWLKLFKAAHRGDGSSAWRLMSNDELAAVKGKVNLTSQTLQSTPIVDLAYLRSIESAFGAHSHVIDCLENIQRKRGLPRVVKATVKRLRQVTGSRGDTEAAAPSTKDPKVAFPDHNSTEGHSQQHNASTGVTLDCIHAHGDAYYLGWELSMKLLGGLDGDSARPLLDRVQSPDGQPGWRGMTPHEWAALPASTNAGVGDDHLMPVLVKACCLRPLLEEVGFDAAVISALVDVPASSDKTKGTCHEVSPDDGSPGYTLRLEKVTVPFDTSLPPTLAGIGFRTIPPHQSESAEPGLPTISDPSTGGSSNPDGRPTSARTPVLPRKRSMSGHCAASKAKTRDLPVSPTVPACRSSAKGADAIPQGAAKLRRSGGMSPLPMNVEPTADSGIGPGTSADGQGLRDTGPGAGNCATPQQPGMLRGKGGRNCGSEGQQSPVSPDLPRPAAGKKGGVSVQSVELPDMETPAGDPVVVHVIQTQGASFCIAAQLAGSVLGLTPRKGWLNAFKAARRRDRSYAWRYMSVDELAAVKGEVNFTSWGPRSTLLVELAYLRSIKSAFGAHTHVVDFLENLQSKRRVPRDVNTMVKRTRRVTGSRGDTEAAAPSPKKPKARSKKVEPPAPTMIDGEEHWDVDQILGHRTVKTAAGVVKEYLVSWKGWGREDDSWEPEEFLDGSKELLSEYLSRL